MLDNELLKINNLEVLGHHIKFKDFKLVDNQELKMEI